MIDDDADMLKLTERWLVRAGYEILTAGSGSEGFSLLLQKGADLVLLDYAMPGMDGPSTLEAIRSSEKLKNIPVLFRTGMEDAVSAQIMENLKAGVVSKADGKPVLLSAVADALS